MKCNPVTSDYFIFVNQCKTQIKIMYFDITGFCLWAKRLELGQFRLTPSPDGQRIIRAVDLQFLLEGIEIHKARHFKRYLHGKETNSLYEKDRYAFSRTCHSEHESASGRKRGP